VYPQVVSLRTRGDPSGHFQLPLLDLDPDVRVLLQVERPAGIAVVAGERAV